jgi:uncharacterized protein (DUF58 family)
VNPRPTALAFAVATVLVWMLLLSVLTDHAELLIAAIPLAVGLLDRERDSGLPLDLDLQQQLSETRMAEGGRAVVAVSVEATTRIPIVEILAQLPPLIECEPDNNNRMVLAATPGQQSGWSFAVRCPARGRYTLGLLHFRVWARSGMTVSEGYRAAPRAISVYPSTAMIRHVPPPLRTQISFGNYLSARVGEGIEPGEIRAFMPGDRSRRINWRASLRLRQLYVTQYHEERNADVVVMLDTLSEVGVRPWSTLDLSVRVAGALANAYAARKDRVGLIVFGGALSWIKPATGLRQAEALLEGMLPAASHFTYVVPELDRLPPRILPPEAMIIAISPLLDDRFVTAVVDLAARGFDVIVIAVSPIEPTRGGLSGSWLDEIGCRLWGIEWRDEIDALRQRGLVILEWRLGAPLDAVLAPLARSRRRWTARR